MDNPSQCQALNVSDEKRCIETATSLNGFFCAFHSRQCQGLYRGYKLRNAKLDRLVENSPNYLAAAKAPLHSLTYEDVSSHETLKEIHDHLFLRLQLLERVIRARKLHMSRFCSQDMDYGHVKWVEHLQSQKSSTVRALEKLERQTSEFLYKKQKWYTWVRECQDDEGKNGEKEQKKVKAEAAMFRRHWKAAQLRQNDKRAKEDKLREDAFLEQIYKERMAERERNGERAEEDDEMDWDPIEDVLEDSRGSYIDLIQTFLWMTASESIPDITKEDSTGASIAISKDPPDSSPNSNVTLVDSPSASNSAKKPKPKSKSKKKKKTSNSASSSTQTTAPAPEPDKSLIETRQEMHDRLKNGEDFNNDNVVGMMIAGTIENPVISTKTITFPEDEIKRLQDEIFQIKHLLFCRLLLGHAALLPAALRANIVEEFLADQEVTTGELRDLCLKMENPSLQDIRDACADFFRVNEETDEDLEPSREEAEEPAAPYSDLHVFQKRKGDLPDKWVSKREKTKRAAEAMGAPMPTVSEMLGEGGGAVDFGNTQGASPSPTGKIKVKICGRTIWNYPSSKAMNRGGWLHFCVMAKESNLHDAIALCRHWDEFFELNVLAIWGYFPGKNWAEWVGNRWRQQMLQLGFIVYFESAKPDARDLTVRIQEGGRRGPVRRSHNAFEARNFICAHIKRDNQASRRLVQYLSMQSHRLLVLVRDAESGRLLIKPPEDQRWLYRQKSGLGRVSRNDDWQIIKSIGPDFFDDMDKFRQWSFSFKEYYDVYVWDLEAGEPFPCLYNAVQETLTKALRCRTPPDLYNPVAPVIRTLYKDETTHRVRDIKPGDDVKSIYDNSHSPDVKFRYGTVDDPWGKNASGLAPARKVFEEDNTFPMNLFYTKADELEGEVLFPEEREAQMLDPSQIGKIEPLSQWEETFTCQGFIEGWDSEYTEDTDDENLEYDSEWEDEDDLEADLSEDNGSEGLQEGHEEEESTVSDTHEDLPITPNEIFHRMPFSSELKEAMKKLSLKSGHSHRVRPNTKPKESEMREEFMTFLDREKAKVFKVVWHKADLSPHAQIRYTEMTKMIKKIRKYNHEVFDYAPVILAFKLIHELDLSQDKKDLHKAIAKMTPFFHQDFFASADGEGFKDSLLFRQEERAKAPQDERSHHSNKTRPAEFYEEFDAAAKAAQYLPEDFPEEWDIVIRPIIAHLYKAGVIRTRADTYHETQAFAAKEPGRDKYDLYFEARDQIETVRMPPHVKNPYDVPSFKAFARAFTKKHPGARFAVLSLWSAPHFYPLMIGHDNHDATSFRDLQGRNFIWKFVPKDMPCSEWSIHITAQQRVEPFKKYLKDRVVVKREKYLVMGVDEKDLLRLASATTFAIQTRPWRQEVDLWKSFVNVDVGFIEALDERWME